MDEHVHESLAAPAMPALPQPKASMFEGASPKLTFVMGVVVGVAAVSLAGFVLASAYVLLGRGGGTLVGTTAPAPTPATPAAAQPNSPPAKVNVAVKPTDYVRGPANAPVTVIEYSDLECPFCKRFHPSMQQLMQEFPSQIRWVYRHYPLDNTCNTAMAQQLHPNACQAAYAAECVGKLAGGDKFWSFVDAVFSEDTPPDRTRVAAIARSLGVNESRLTGCMASQEITDRVQVDLREGGSYGVNGTPTSFVNGTPVEGAVPYEQLKAVVEAALSQ